MPSLAADPPGDSPKRRLIIEGAAIVFSEEGYEGASMSRIAERAGVSKGTLYNYFTSKSDLFAAYIERETSQGLAWILEAAETDGDIPAALRSIGRRLVRTLLSDATRTLTRILISEAPKFPELARIFFEAGQGRGTARLADWLTAQTAQGRLRVQDPLLAAEQFIALCRARFWMGRCLHLIPEVADAELDLVIEANVDMFLRSYGPHEAENDP